jgi:hypothetical protein
MQRPSSVDGRTPAEDEIGISIDHRDGHKHEIRRIKRSVAVHETDDIRLGCQQSSVTSRSETALGLPYDGGPERTSNVSRPVD